MEDSYNDFATLQAYNNSQPDARITFLMQHPDLETTDVDNFTKVAREYADALFPGKDVISLKAKVGLLLEIANASRDTIYSALHGANKEK